MEKLLHSNEPCVVIGVRSSVFLPFGKLGIVIVDEEHETSYKQQDPAPRYNARDAALILASMHGAKTLLGSATPSIQTYYKAESGKYGLVNLSTRFEGVELPAVRVIDTKQSRKRKENARSVYQRTCQRMQRRYREGRTGNHFPEPPGIRTDGEMQGMRMDSEMRELVTCR